MIVCGGILFFVGIVVLLRGKVTISGGRQVTGTRARVVGAFFVLPIPIMLLLDVLIGRRFEDLELVKSAAFFLCLLIGVVVGISDENPSRSERLQQNLPPILTLKDAARYLKVSEKDVFDLIESGRLPATMIGGEYRVARENLDAMFRP